MASVSLLGATVNSNSGTHNVTATPAVNDLIVIFTLATGNSSTARPTDNQGGKYHRIKIAKKASDADIVMAFVRTGLVASAVSTVFTHAPGTSTGGGLAVIKVTGMSRAGIAAILQNASQDNQSSGGTPTPVFGATPQSGNPVIGIVVNAANPAAMTPRSGYTELGDSGYNSPTTGFESMYRNSGETSASIAWGSTSGSAFCDIAVELDTTSAPTTRRYLPSTGAAPVSPSFDAGFEETSDADRIKMVETKISSAMTTKSITTVATAGDALVRQFVSDPMEAQTIACPVYIYARALETLATVDALSRIVLKVVSNDGSSVTGTLFALADYSTGTEWNTALRNKSFANGNGADPVDVNAGDRLVLEMGFNHAALVSSAGINFGDDSGTDLGENETDTAANNPWLEFRQTITFQSGAPTINLDTASLSATGRVLDVQPGTRTITLDVSSLLAQGRLLDVQPGTRNIPMDVALLTVSGQIADIQPGIKSTLLDVVLLTTQGRLIDVQNINNILLDTSSTTLMGQVVDIQPGARSVALDVVLLTALGQIVDVQPGARSILMDVALLTALGRTISVGGVTVIPLDAASLSATGRAITVLEGGVSKLLDTALLTAQGRLLDVQQGVSSLLLDTVILTGQGRILDVQTGGISIPLDVSQVSTQGRTITILEGGVIILLDTVSLLANAPDITISTIVAAIARLWTLQERVNTWTLDGGRGTLNISNRGREWTVDN